MAGEHVEVGWQRAQTLHVPRLLLWPLSFLEQRTPPPPASIAAHAAPRNNGSVILGGHVHACVHVCVKGREANWDSFPFPGHLGIHLGPCPVSPRPRRRPGRTRLGHTPEGICTFPSKACSSLPKKEGSGQQGAPLHRAPGPCTRARGTASRRGLRGCPWVGGGGPRRSALLWVHTAAPANVPVGLQAVPRGLSMPPWGEGRPWPLGDIPR